MSKINNSSNNPGSLFIFGSPLFMGATLAMQRIVDIAPRLHDTLILPIWGSFILSYLLMITGVNRMDKSIKCSNAPPSISSQVNHSEIPIR